ncbi:MAG: hypothetical protein ABIE74_02555 [Pseudomonadota bacterium]
MFKKDQLDLISKKLIEKHGEASRKRIETGLKQVAMFWKEGDGSIGDLEKICLEHFVSDEKERSELTKRFDSYFETLLGYLKEIYREMRWKLDVDEGDLKPIDRLFAGYSPSAHFVDDMFSHKIAFVILLNFEILSLDERLKECGDWSRDRWAKDRVASGFDARVPSEIESMINKAFVEADEYIYNYNFFMNKILTQNGKRLFPEGLKLISHWGLRDQIKADYLDPDGIEKQELIYEVMKRIVHQEVPKSFVNSDKLDWVPRTNELKGGGDNSTENNRRYEILLNVFHAYRKEDKYYPLMPTHIDRRFQKHREIPEKKVEGLFVELLKSDEVAKTAELVKNRLGRSLRPFDIWYHGFKPKPKKSMDELDKLVKAKYPNVEALQRDIPNVLKRLGFMPEEAEYLGERIQLDSSRAAGHAMSPGRKVDKAHIRLRVPKDGVDYQGFNVFMHELGHGVETVYSLNRMDYNVLRGVPNTAFTEAFAFTLQDLDLEMLGVVDKKEEDDHYKVLDTLWTTAEIGGVALVDMGVWHWMYDHPDAKPAELKDAVLNISKDIWNKYFAKNFGEKESVLLGVYSHMIDSALYLPDYPLGFIIYFQIQEYLKNKNLAKEMERMCRIGSVAPDVWMKEAVGSEVSVKPLIEAAKRALESIKT